MSNRFVALLCRAPLTAFALLLVKVNLLGDEPATRCNVVVTSDNAGI